MFKKYNYLELYTASRSQKHATLFLGITRQTYHWIQKLSVGVGSKFAAKPWL